jgi:uncharacterized membrane protein YraQ (UPF0718 family)
MVFLALSIVALFIGPAVFPLLRSRPSLIAALDGFLLASIGGLVLVDLLPHALHVAGGWAFLAAALGLGAPAIIDSRHRANSPKETAACGQEHEAQHEHGALVNVALLGLAIHAFVDGSALAVPEVQVHDSAAHLATAVLMHRVPVGLLVATMAAKRRGIRGALAAAGLLALATIAGFVVAREALPYWELRELALFQAFIAGTLLHVVMAHAPLASEHSHEAWPRTAALGAIAGVASVWSLITGHPTVAHSATSMSPGEAFMALALAAAPALLLAFVGAGLLNSFVPMRVFHWMSRGPRAMQSLRGMAFGLPLSACSCGILPFYQTLVARGVAPAAAVAFLIATPEIGLDALLISLPLLGTELTLLRVASAAVVAWVVAIATSFWMSDQTVAPHDAAIEQSNPVTNLSVGQKLIDGLRYGFAEVPDHILPWVLVGLGVAAFAEPMLDHKALAALPTFWQVPMAAVIGMPLYVCASGSTPLVAVLLFKGLSPGAAIAFLLTGPATNTTTFGALSNLHGRNASLAFCFWMLAAGCMAGWSVDLLGPTVNPMQLHHAHGDEVSGFAALCLGILGLVTLTSLWRSGPRGMLAQLHPDYALSDPCGDDDGHCHDEHSHGHH